MALRTESRECCLARLGLLLGATPDGVDGSLCGVLSDGDTGGKSGLSETSLDGVLLPSKFGSFAAAVRREVGGLGRVGGGGFFGVGPAADLMLDSETVVARGIRGGGRTWGFPSPAPVSPALVPLVCEGFRSSGSMAGYSRFCNSSQDPMDPKPLRGFK